ncbi:MAG: radical SAM protein [bacterium]
MKLSGYLRWISFYFSRTPFYAVFYVTSRCNARCGHCFNWKSADDAGARRELTLEEIEKIAKNWGEMLIINLAGGEAYLRDDLVEIVGLFKKYTGVEIVAIPSNGFLTDKITETAYRLLKNFPNLHFRFTFSIDGIGEKHDKIRGVPGGFERVVKTVAAVKELRKEHGNFSIFTNSCFMQSNQDDFLDILKFIKDNLAVDALNVTRVRGNVRSEETQKNLHNEKYREAVDYISRANFNKSACHPLPAFIRAVSTLAQEKVLENLETGRRNFECYAIKKMTVIDDLGEVKVCEMLSVSLGNLRDADYDIKKIATSVFADAEYGKIRRHECNCVWECAVRTGIICNLKEYPAVLMRICGKNKSRPDPESS